MSGKLPKRPQWYREMVARLRAQRTGREFEPHEFLEHAADEVEDHPDFVRFLARSDVAAYDRKVTTAQRADFEDEVTATDVARYVTPSLFPEEVLARLGLDRRLKLGFDRDVETADATHEDRMKAIAELERKKKSWEKSIDREIAAIEALDELAGDKTLREVVSDVPDEYGTGEP